MKILVVEDDTTNCFLIAQILTAEGHEVLMADSAEKALNILQINKPDLIFMDIRLPGMDGIEATKTLKNNPETKDIPVIALTAFALKEDREKAAEAGFELYITKPFRYDEIINAINRVGGKSGRAQNTYS